MDCKTARLLLDFRRPRVGELPADEAAALEHHLASCPDCGAAGLAERRLDDALGRAVRDVPLPDGLRERLLARLATERRAALRRRVLRLTPALAAAASLLVGALVWWHVVGSRPPRLDLASLSEESLQQHRAFSKESVESWFLEKRQVTMVAPAAFNYTLLVDADMADLQGKRVPKLTFQGGTARATVYVITREQFDVEALARVDPAQFDSFGQHTRIWRPRAERPDTAYIILFDGDALDPLLTQEPGA